MSLWVLKRREERTAKGRPYTLLRATTSKTPSREGLVLVPWPTAQAAATLVPWATPGASDDKQRYSNPEIVQRRLESGKQMCIEAQAFLTYWPTPNAMAGGQTSRSGDRIGEPLMGGIVRGLAELPGLPKNAKLNPRFSLWLMGYPDAWALAGSRAHAKGKAA